jgi:protein-disulfide isomerase
MPLQKHDNALAAAEAAACAGQQGKFWYMHDLLFRNSRQLNVTNYEKWAEELGLDNARFRSCLIGSSGAEVEQDVVEADRLGVSGTPSFFFGELVGGTMVKVLRRTSGALSFERFKTLIDETLVQVARKQS